MNKFFMWMALKGQSGWYGLRKPLCGAGQTLGWALRNWRSGSHYNGKPMSLLDTLIRWARQ